MIFSTPNLPPRPTYWTASREMVGDLITEYLITSPASNAWPSANRAYFVPFTIPTTVVIQSLFTMNGSATGDSFDLGIFNPDGVKLTSTGATSQSGTSVIQNVALGTPYTLAPGPYFIGLACNGTTSTFLGWTPSTVQRLQMFGLYSQNTAYALPAVATFATIASAFFPAVGFATAATV